MERTNVRKAGRFRTALPVAGTVCGYVCLVAGLACFFHANSELMSRPGLLKGLASVSMASPLLFLIPLEVRDKRIAYAAGAALYAAAAGLLLHLILNGMALDLFQPLMLNAASAALVPAGAGILLVSGLVLFLTGRRRAGTAIPLAVCLVLSCGPGWAETQDWMEFGTPDRRTVFAEDEGGYSSFRIPSLALLDGETLESAYGMPDTDGVLYAFCEGRKNSARDTGDIDIVYKCSRDGGESWGPLRVLFSFGEEHGKYGNPVSVINPDTGTFHFFCMRARRAGGYRYESLRCRLRVLPDLSLEPYGETPFPEDGSAPLTLGPGKGAYVPEYGRILVPCSRNGKSFAAYSDTDGRTWSGTDGASAAGDGNECEAACVNGTVLMAVRDNADCSGRHEEQYVRLASSGDGGRTWSGAEPSGFRTPICMTSVCALRKDGEDALLLTHPDSFRTRANLVLREVRGETVRTVPLYKGASGYSCVIADGRHIYVLAEIGRVNYSETLTLFRIPA